MTLFSVRYSARFDTTSASRPARGHTTLTSRDLPPALAGRQSRQQQLLYLCPGTRYRRQGGYFDHHGRLLLTARRPKHSQGNVTEITTFDYTVGARAWFADRTLDSSVVSTTNGPGLVEPTVVSLVEGSANAKWDLLNSHILRVTEYMAT